MCTTQPHPIHSVFANLTKQAAGRSLIAKVVTNLFHFFKGVVHFTFTSKSNFEHCKHHEIKSNVSAMQFYLGQCLEGEKGQIGQVNTFIYTLILQ